LIPEINMDMSFANQPLAAEWFVKRIDKQVAKLKLKAMGVIIDRLTMQQRNYLSSWEQGT